MSYITKNSFSYPRFIMLLKREFTNNRQQLMLQALVLIGMIIAVEAFVTYAFYHNWEQSNLYYNGTPHDSTSGVIMCLWIFGLFLFSTISASFTCSQLSSKAGRVNALMSVGTQLEKYLCRVLPYTIGFFLFYCVAAGVIDWFRCLYIEIATPVHPIYFYKQIIINWDREFVIIATGSFLLLQSFFTMISAFAPKLSFIKGFCVAIGIVMALGILFTALSPIIEMINISFNSILYTYFTASIIFSAAMHYIAYYRYKDTDIQ